MYNLEGKTNEYLSPRSKLLVGKTGIHREELRPLYSNPKILSQKLQYNPWHVVPTPVQSVLLEHPAVKDVIVIGFPSEMNDKNPFALVTLRSGYEMVTTKDLLEYVNYKLFFKGNIQGGLKIIRESSLSRTYSGRPTDSSIYLAMNSSTR